MGTAARNFGSVQGAMTRSPGHICAQSNSTGTTRCLARRSVHDRRNLLACRMRRPSHHRIHRAGSCAVTFQQRVQGWMWECFGLVISRDRTERNHRFLEEALELVQAAGCTQNEAHQLVDYVFNRPIGELNQEIGGVMVTLAAFCSAHDADM